jgi:hypothetical protein
VLSKWEIGDLRPEDVPDLAAQALAEGCTASELAVLATLTRPTRIDIEDELPSLLASLGVVRPPKRLALKIVIDDCVSEIAEQRLDPAGGAHKLWMLARENYAEPNLFGQLAVYVGLASEWDDHPEARPEIESQIIRESQHFVGAGGLNLDA